MIRFRDGRFDTAQCGPVPCACYADGAVFGAGEEFASAWEGQGGYGGGVRGQCAEGAVGGVFGDGAGDNGDGG